MINNYMNRLETWIVNSRIRGLVQKYWELPLLKKMGMRTDGQCLEIGCGNGNGVSILGPNWIGLDLMKKSRNGIVYVQGDACRLPFADRTFDCIYESATFHHIPDWRLALWETMRVVRPGGMFAFADFTKQGLKKFWCFSHPKSERFGVGDLITAMLGYGKVEIIDVNTRMFGDIVMGIVRKCG